MKKIITGFLFLIISLELNSAQVNISIEYKPLKIRSFNEKTEVFTSEEIKDIPGLTLDEKISYIVSGANISRTNGIYSYKSNISLRGFSSMEQGRTLILLDGVPLNTFATGSVNWNMVSLEDIEKIEILKGAGSFLYGPNAVAGIINIVTKKPSSGYELYQSVGSYDTYITSLKGGYKGIKNSFSLKGTNIDSKGYISTPLDLRDQYTVKRYLREKSVSLRDFLKTDKNGDFDFKYIYYDGIRGEGSKIMTADGVSRNFQTNFASAKWNYKGNKIESEAFLYYQNEDYSRLQEYYKSGVYTRINSDVIREDMAFNYSGVFDLFEYKNLIGFEYKKAGLNGKDTQIFPSYSKSYDRGDIYSYSFYNNIKRKFSNLEGMLGLRYDRAFFYDGYYANDAYSENAINGPLPEKSWDSFSPKFFLSYHYSPMIEQYFSYGKAFRPAVLEDMCLSLLKKYGFIEANPSLKPEKVDSIETGFKITPSENFHIEPYFYDDFGKDFIYEIKTDKTVNINGQNKAVYRKENIAKVRIYGFEIPLKLFYGNYSFYYNYSYSRSELLKYPANPSLEGNQLTYSPEMKMSAILSYSFKKINLNLSWKYKSSQFIDDSNTQKISPYSIYSSELVFNLNSNIETGLKVENIFDKRYLESQTDMSPGRFVSIYLRYNF